MTVSQEGPGDTRLSVDLAPQRSILFDHTSSSLLERGKRTSSASGADDRFKVGYANQLLTFTA
jgi:hypothetical protein